MTELISTSRCGTLGKSEQSLLLVDLPSKLSTCVNLNLTYAVLTLGGHDQSC